MSARLAKRIVGCLTLAAAFLLPAVDCLPSLFAEELKKTAVSEPESANVLQGINEQKGLGDSSGSVEVHRNLVEIEKKMAELKLKEAEAARRAAELAKESERNQRKVAEAYEIAQRKEKEAAEAMARLKIAEENMRLAEERAKVSEERLILAQQRAAIAAERDKKAIIYRKAAQTVLLLLLGYLLIYLVVGFINRQVRDIKARHTFRKNAVYFLNFVIVLLIVLLWLQDLSSFTIFFSVLGAGFALALQEVILCMAGWVFILIRRPFEVGDRIELNGVIGDVIDIRLFQTSLLEVGNWVGAEQSTGRIVNIPNSAVFKKENYNYNRGFEFIWNELKVLITFESDWRKAEEIMLMHANKLTQELEVKVKQKVEMMARHYMIHFQKFSPKVYVDIKDSGVELSLRYLTEVRKRRGTQDELSRAILDDFKKEPSVDFAYTTYRIVK